MGTSTISTGPFSIAILVYQRVPHAFEETNVVLLLTFLTHWKWGESTNSDFLRSKASHPWHMGIGGCQKCEDTTKKCEDWTDKTTDLNLVGPGSKIQHPQSTGSMSILATWLGCKHGGPPAGSPWLVSHFGVPPCGFFAGKDEKWRLTAIWSH
jgi:hypothetical protein